MAQLDLYRDLPPIKGQKLKFTSSSPFTPEFVQSSLVDHPAAATAYTSRVQGRQILLENPAKESESKKAADARKFRRDKDRARKKAGVISRKEAKQKGVWKFDEKDAKYQTFVPIHHLWLGYMAELLSLPARPVLPLDPVPPMPNALAMQSKLVKADFHGSILTVKASRNSSLVGISGIVIHETENTFKLVTPQDKLKVIPKQNSIFILSILLYGPPLPGVTPESEPRIEFELYGNHFCFRASDRASRKFKPKETIEL